MGSVKNHLLSPPQRPEPARVAMEYDKPRPWNSGRRRQLEDVSGAIRGNLMLEDIMVLKRR